MIDLEQDILAQYYFKKDQLSFGQCDVYLTKNDLKVGHWYRSNQKIKNIVYYEISRDEMLCILNDHINNKPYNLEHEELLDLKLLYISENFLDFLFCRIKKPCFIKFNHSYFLDLNQEYQLHDFDIKDTSFTISLSQQESLDSYHSARWISSFNPWICDLILEYYSLKDPTINNQVSRNDKLRYWQNVEKERS